MNRKAVIRKRAQIRKRIKEVLNRGLNTWYLIQRNEGHGTLKGHEMNELFNSYKLEFHVLNYQLISYGDYSCPLGYMGELCDQNTPFICTSCLINSTRGMYE